MTALQLVRGSLGRKYSRGAAGLQARRTLAGTLAAERDRLQAA
ncbi:hypothetical protein [Rubrivirga sp. SAORIC476]|nr:hypothetical protein [Rubrivirga sp. SAORIC476]